MILEIRDIFCLITTVAVTTVTTVLPLSILLSTDCIVIVITAVCAVTATAAAPNGGDRCGNCFDKCCNDHQYAFAYR